jgi:PAS domain S-box-containing protein
MKPRHELPSKAETPADRAPTVDPAVFPELDAVHDPVALLQGLFAHSPVPHILFDVQGHPIVANRAYRAMLGAVPPADYCVLRDEVAAAAGVADAVARAFLGETVETPTFWYDPKELRHIEVTDANRVAISCTSFPLRGADGAVAQVAVTYKDVTAQLLAKDRAEAEHDRLALVLAEKERLARALHEEEERLRTTLEAAAVGTWEWLIAEDRVDWSPNIEAIFGRAPGEFDGSYWLALVHPEDRDAVANATTEALARGSSYAVEFRFVRRDGTVGWQSARGHVVRGDAGLSVVVDTVVRPERRPVGAVALESRSTAVGAGRFALARSERAVITPSHRRAGEDAPRRFVGT